jgi:hypothetical protein
VSIQIQMWNETQTLYVSLQNAPIKIERKICTWDTPHSWFGRINTVQHVLRCLLDKFILSVFCLLDIVWCLINHVTNLWCSINKNMLNNIFQIKPRTSKFPNKKYMKRHKATNWFGRPKWFKEKLENTKLLTNFTICLTKTYLRNINENVFVFLVYSNLHLLVKIYKLLTQNAHVSS